MIDDSSLLRELRGEFMLLQELLKAASALRVRPGTRSSLPKIASIAVRYFDPKCYIHSIVAPLITGDSIYDPSPE